MEEQFAMLSDNAYEREIQVRRNMINKYYKSIINNGFKSLHDNFSMCNNINPDKDNNKLLMTNDGKDIKILKDELKEYIIPMDEEEAIKLISKTKLNFGYSHNKPAELFEFSKDKTVCILKKPSEYSNFNYESNNIIDSLYIKVKMKDNYIIRNLAFGGSIRRLSADRTEFEYDNALDNLKNIVRYNSHKFLGKTAYDTSTNSVKTITYKSKETGENIELKHGLLLNCSTCNSYDAINEFEVILAINIKAMNSTEYKMSNYISLCSLMSIKCPSCGEEINFNDFSYIGIDNNVHGTVYRNVFYDGHKITLASIKNSIMFYGDMKKTKSISYKTVLNMDSGRSYELPLYDIKAKKKKSVLRQLNVISANNYLSNTSVSHEDLMEIGLTIENHLRSKENVNQKALIPFSEYVKQLQEVKNKSSLRVVSKLVSPIHNTANVSGIERLEILLAYNNNPYIHYDNLMKCQRLALGSIHNSHSNNKINYKAKKIKKIRNANIEKDLLSAYNVTTKKEKQFVNSNTRTSNYRIVYKAKQVFKDPNNINKILNSAKEFHYSLEIEKTPLLLKLIETFGETNVVNALIKNQNDRPSNYYDYVDTIENYNNIVSVIPEYQLPSNRLRIKDLHDKIASDANKIRNKKKIYMYEDDFMEKFNKNINGIKFRVATSNHELANIGSQMYICVGGYSYRVEDKSLFIVSLVDENSPNKYIGCMEISNKGCIVQAKAERNHFMSEKLQETVFKYAEECGLSISAYDMGRKYYRDAKDELKNFNIKLKIATQVEDDIIKEILTGEEVPIDLNTIEEVEDNRGNNAAFAMPMPVQMLNLEDAVF